MWASAGQADFTNELAALKQAISTYGSAFGKACVGISVGSEDLYRITPTGIANKAGVGAGPDVITNFISQARSAIAGTVLSGCPVGHVDTWTAWVNSSNDAVISASDFIGMDAYPYFQTTLDNSIETANQTFFAAYDATLAAVGSKPVWITETGWPVSGPTENLAVPSISNAQTYWDQVACAVLGKINTFWYTLQDAAPTTPAPSFGLIGSTLTTTPLYNLTCPAAGSVTNTTSSSSSATVISATSATSAPSVMSPGPIATSSGSSGSVAGFTTIPGTTVIAPGNVTSVVYTTDLVTITSCASTVSSCPAITSTTTYAVSTATFISSSTSIAPASVVPVSSVPAATGVSSMTTVIASTAPGGSVSTITTVIPVTGTPVAPGNGTVATGAPTVASSNPIQTAGGAAVAAGSVGGLVGLALALAAAL